MANETISLKNERIIEIDNAANSTENSEGKSTDKVIEETKYATKPNETTKKDIVRYIGYPVVLSSVFGIGGLLIANKFIPKESKLSKKLMIIAFILGGAGAGILLYSHWEKKNANK